MPDNNFVPTRDEVMSFMPRVDSYIPGKLLVPAEPGVFFSAFEIGPNRWRWEPTGYRDLFGYRPENPDGPPDKVLEAAEAMGKPKKGSERGLTVAVCGTDDNFEWTLIKNGDYIPSGSSVRYIYDYVHDRMLSPDNKDDFDDFVDLLSGFEEAEAEGVVLSDAEAYTSGGRQYFWPEVTGWEIYDLRDRTAYGDSWEAEYANEDYQRWRVTWYAKNLASSDKPGKYVAEYLDARTEGVFTSVYEIPKTMAKMPAWFKEQEQLFIHALKLPNKWVLTSDSTINDLHFILETKDGQHDVFVEFLTDVLDGDEKGVIRHVTPDGVSSEHDWVEESDITDYLAHVVNTSDLPKLGSIKAYQLLGGAPNEYKFREIANEFGALIKKELQIKLRDIDGKMVEGTQFNVVMKDDNGTVFGYHFVPTSPESRQKALDRGSFLAPYTSVKYLEERNPNGHDTEPERIKRGSVVIFREWKADSTEQRRYIVRDANDRKADLIALSGSMEDAYLYAIPLENLVLARNQAGTFSGENATYLEDAYNKGGEFYPKHHAITGNKYWGLYQIGDESWMWMEKAFDNTKGDPPNSEMWGVPDYVVEEATNKVRRTKKTCFIIKIGSNRYTLLDAGQDLPPGAEVAVALAAPPISKILTPKAPLWSSLEGVPVPAKPIQLERKERQIPRVGDLLFSDNGKGTIRLYEVSAVSSNSVTRFKELAVSNTIQRQRYLTKTYMPTTSNPAERFVEAPDFTVARIWNKKEGIGLIRTYMPELLSDPRRQVWTTDSALGTYTKLVDTKETEKAPEPMGSDADIKARTIVVRKRDRTAATDSRTLLVAAKEMRYVVARRDGDTMDICPLSGTGRVVLRVDVRNYELSPDQDLRFDGPAAALLETQYKLLSQPNDGTIHVNSVVVVKGKRRRFVVVRKSGNTVDMVPLSGGPIGKKGRVVPINGLVLSPDQTIAFTGVDERKREKEYETALGTAVWVVVKQRHVEDGRKEGIIRDPAKIISDATYTLWKRDGDTWAKVGNYWGAIIMDRRKMFTDPEYAVLVQDVDPNELEKPAADVPEGKKHYVYGLQFRPVGMGTVPKGYISTGVHPDFKKFGTITYDHPLSDEEVRSYELIRIVTEQNEVNALVDGIVDTVVDAMSSGGDPEYAKIWLEEIEDDRGYAMAAVGQAIEKRKVHLPVSRSDVLQKVIEKLTRMVQK